MNALTIGRAINRSHLFPVRRQFPFKWNMQLAFTSAQPGSRRFKCKLHYRHVSSTTRLHTQTESDTTKTNSCLTAGMRSIRHTFKSARECAICVDGRAACDCVNNVMCVVRAFTCARIPIPSDRSRLNFARL